MRGGNYDKDMDLDGVWVLVKKAVDSLDNTKRKEINEVEHPPKELSWDDFLSMYMSVAKDTNNRLVKKGDDHDDTFLAHGTLVEVKEGNDWREGVYRGFKKRYGWGKTPNEHTILFDGELETLNLKDKNKKWNYGITVNGAALLFWIWDNWGVALKGFKPQSSTLQTQLKWYKLVIEELKKMWDNLDSSKQKKELEKGPQSLSQNISDVKSIFWSPFIL